jgi:RNA polymerase sigma-70 factor (sigma-E family)
VRAAGAPGWSATLAGDPGAAAEFESFFRAHHRDLARVAYALTGDHTEADDVVADALTAAWSRWDRVSAADHPLAYVRGSVVKLAASRVRRRVSERRRWALLGPLPVWRHWAAGVEPDVGPRVVARVDLRAAVLALPERRRACVVLRHVAGLSTVEVAETLGISEGAVKSQTWKGLAQLRRVLGDAHAPAERA